MTTYYFGLNKGQQDYNLMASGTSTTGRQIELKVDNSAGFSKQEILIAVDAFKREILDNRATPFTGNAG